MFSTTYAKNYIGDGSSEMLRRDFDSISERLKAFADPKFPLGFYPAACCDSFMNLSN